MSEENEIKEEIAQHEEVTTEAEEQFEETEETVADASTALTVTPKKMKKHTEAKMLVDEAKNLVETSESELQDCRLLLEDDLREYSVAKNALRTHAFDETQALLTELGYMDPSNENQEEYVVFEAKEDVEPLVLKDVRSGRFTGLLLSLLGGLFTFLGLIFWATEKRGMTLDITKMPSVETVKQLFGVFGTQVGHSEDALYGGLFVGSIVLVVMLLIYLVRVWLKGNANLHFATQQMKETQKYITYKSNCKAEMDRVDTHIKEAVAVLKDYEVVLGEQNGKLKRIQHFEGKRSNPSEYHNKSLQEMKQTQTLVDNIGRFISTSMSEEGKLSGKSTLFLHSAKESMHKMMQQFM